ncbi:MAG: NADP-dependent phosphogluconate dehydrogenase [Peptoniphilaceae bacterium]|nr:NADP-dependent phosphogluconate dehydrogenase [Peptoniphilaceae bacterium]
MGASRIGVVGMAVMGKSLALNIADNGFQVSVYNRSEGKTKEAVAEDRTGNIQGYFSLEEFIDSLESPKNILLMVKSGVPVDGMIDRLFPFLHEGDLIIDGGNSYFKDTVRRANALEKKGIHFFGMGVSGGEEGARRGPAIMPGGDRKAYERVRDILEAISAKAEDGEPCCKYTSSDGAGHYVKMVHNGIEYADMQIIAEGSVVMKQILGMDNRQMSEAFRHYNEGPLESYLIEITANLLQEPDDMGNGFLVDKILDSAEQKGTGKWTNLEAVDLGVNTSILAAGLNARILSSQKAERIQAAKIYSEEVPSLNLDKGKVLKELEGALLAAKIMSYAQGFALYRKAAESYGWDFNYREIASIFRAGCIIRARLLYDLMEEFGKNNDLVNIMLSESFAKKLHACVPGLRKVVSYCIAQGIACPAMSAALSYFDAYCTENSEANIIQAQRDYFGAHTYQRNDGREGYFHHAWVENI